MIAALATLVFLSTLWMLVVVGAAVLEGSGGKVRAALSGRSVGPISATRPVRMRFSRDRADRPLRARARIRAAA